MTQRYHPRTKHSVTYYQSVLFGLHDAVVAGQTHQQIADSLNAKSLLSPYGKPWTAVAVRKALWKLRNNHNEPSLLHAALMRLAFWQIIPREKALVLLSPSPVL